jgi:putative Holliday junction resolvase
MQAQAVGRPQNSSKNLSIHSSQASDPSRTKEVAIPGRLLAIDLGAKRLGIAVTDELQITVTSLERIERRNWKDLLRRVSTLVESYDARALIIGLPLNIDGTRGPAAEDALRIAENFRKSLNVPVFLEDERLTSRTAESDMQARGVAPDEIRQRVDSESAAIILRDFLAANGRRIEDNPRQR